jgi:hypothetical protein
MDLLPQTFGDHFVSTAGWSRGWRGELRHDALHRPCGPLASLVNPCRVDLQRSGSAAAVAESAGDCSDIDAGRDEFGG